MQLTRQKREAIEVFRPIKREYVAKYRNQCIQKREALSQRQDDLDMLRKVLAVKLKVVYKTPDDVAAGDEVNKSADREKVGSKPILKRHSSADSIYHHEPEHEEQKISVPNLKSPKIDPKPPSKDKSCGQSLMRSLLSYKDAILRSPSPGPTNRDHLKDQSSLQPKPILKSNSNRKHVLQSSSNIGLNRSAASMSSFDPSINEDEVEGQK